MLLAPGFCLASELLSESRSSSEFNHQATIAGQVYDDQSLEPLIGASVYLLNKNVGHSTDSSGSFELEDLPAADYDLVISHVGYESFTYQAYLLAPGEIITIAVGLTRQPAYIGRIVSTGTDPNLPPVENQSYILDRNDLSSVPQFGEDIYRALTRYPGISTNDYSAKFSIRGGEHDELLVLLDGVPLYYPFHLQEIGGGALSSIDQAAIARADLQLAGMSSEWGECPSGILKLTTRDADPGTRQISIAATLLNGRFLALGQSSDSSQSWLLSARRGYLDLVNIETDELKEASPLYYDMLGKYRYKFGANSSLTILAQYSRDKINFAIKRYDFSDSSHAEYESGSVTARVAYGILGGLSGNTSISVNQYLKDVNGFILNPSSMWASGTDRRQTISTTIRHSNRWSFSKFGILQLGASISKVRAKIDYDYVNGVYFFSGDKFTWDSWGYKEDISSTTSSYFASLDLRPHGTIKTLLGLRYDKVSHTAESYLSPRASIAWTPSSSTSLTGSWSIIHQHHPVDQLPVEDNYPRYFEANKVISWSVEAVYRPSSNFNINLQAYLKQYPDPPPEFGNYSDHLQVMPELQYDRFITWLEERNSKGLELILYGQPDRSFTWTLSYALSKSTDVISILKTQDGRYALRNTDPEIPGKYDQRHKLNLDLSWRGGKGWQLTTAWRHYTGRPYSSSVVKYDPSTILIKSRYPNYHRLDLRVNKRFHTGRGDLDLFLEIVNVYNHQNVYAYFNDLECPEGEACRDVDRPYYWLGVFPFVGVSWTWNL